MKTCKHTIAMMMMAISVSMMNATAMDLAKTQPIDIVICLDTSGSMSGLIDAAKQKLWDIVNELAKAQPKPHLRVGLYAYGTPNHGAESGYVQKLVDLTDDLDAVYAKLAPLGTDGGEEYVARVVRAAVREQSWSTDRRALKIIGVAGNEPATQDPQFTTAEICREAISRGIIVNAIYCGAATNPEAEGWREVARAADGQFASIDHQNGTIVINTPFDQKLAALSGELNKTYVSFGARAAEGEALQFAVDSVAPKQVRARRPVAPLPRPMNCTATMVGTSWMRERTKNLISVSSKRRNCPRNCKA
jgi:hypothetical protein